MTPVTVTRGDAPIVLGLPHAGTEVPPEIAQALNETGKALADTDWHVDALYSGLLPQATVVRAEFHRYVIDANRDPEGHSLYPGQNTTTLVPLTDFDGQGIWTTLPTDADVADRRAAFHTPYHAALTSEIARLRQKHGAVILFDCHSIRSRIPFLFDGMLPDFNIGTDNGKTCAPQIAQTVQDICAAAPGYSTVVNGRFKGGWTTRHYGRPAEGVHAIQMELAQSTYLTDEAAPWTVDPAKAARLRHHLTHILTTLAALVPTLGGSR
ncbi:N-formylglutamate deformylase [uncultured Roseobacter sp.]|uniref:N-formylglutamate deformylase n=1 Tax=uncultured Roseobacter sp. TaxID=114847 RepID=UPI00261872D8|nr:N-formylglutamate deformylase [uncultured Roseobacter sp.]